MRRITRRRGGNGNNNGIFGSTGKAIRGCFGRWCRSTTPKNTGENINNATKAALIANASARAARNSHYAGLYGAYTGLPGMRANSVRGVNEIYKEKQANITEQRKKAVLLTEQKEIDRLKRELAELKRGRSRRGSIEGKEAEIVAAEARKKQIEGMTHNQLVGK